MRKLIFNLIHREKLCNKINYNNLSWGWKSPKDIQEIINNSHILFDKYSNNKIDDVKTFTVGCKLAYEIIFHGYQNKIDFLDYNYTCPKLSIALNKLHSLKSISERNFIDIDSVQILGCQLKYGFVSETNKIFGLWSRDEMIKEITTGMIGPEFSHYWDQLPRKLCVRTIVTSDIYTDVVDFESDYKNINWHVSNINEII